MPPLFTLLGLMANSSKIQRMRDPVHGLISFENDGLDARRDQHAWQLINTPEFHRLKRIRQLGVSEFTFPGATHTRFSHSVGVFHTARSLLSVLRRFISDADFNKDKAEMAIFAALLHDIGHGPFSHAFEAVQKARNASKNHEKWSAEIVANKQGRIYPILERFRSGMASAIADMLTADDPSDEYHAIVSSSFDADRLDYLRRDKLMTGSGAGGIDFDWLVDNIRIAEVSLAGDDEEGGATFKTFCLDHKALQAAEAFLLARYHLFEQVYLHKTTRGVETLLRALLMRVAEAAGRGAEKRIGLDKDDALIRFFRDGGDSIENYLALDDFGVWASIARMVKAKDGEVSELARRLRERDLYKAIDVNREFPILPGETFEAAEQRRQEKMEKLEKVVGKKALGKTVLRDSEPISVYGEVGGDEAKRHKKLSIMLAGNGTREITQLSPSIHALIGKRSIVRYYFKDDSERKRVLEEIKK